MTDEFRELLIAKFRWLSDPGQRGLADRTAWPRDPRILSEIGSRLVALFADDSPTVVIGPETSGYLYGPLAAVSADVGFVAAEKERGMLADSDRWYSAITPMDYQGRNMSLHVRARLLSSSDRVLLVDDWVATGGQLRALQSIVEQAGARLIGSAVIVDGLSDHSVRRTLKVHGLLNLRDLRDL